jgi:hypothetical protein
LGLFIGFFFPGSNSFRSPICASVEAKGLSEAYCGGAIDYIGFPIKDYLSLAVDYLPTNTLYFFVFLPLALIPIIFTSWIKENRVFFILFAFTVAPLFMVAIDYGRTIAMFITGVTICLIANSESVKSDVNWTSKMVIPFVTLWGLPHYISPQQKSIPWLGPIEWLLRLISKVT